MRAKRKMLISIIIIAFVLVAVLATVVAVFALTQQTIKTSLKIGYTVQDIDGTASATFTLGGVEENLSAYDKNGNLLGNTLVFKATDTEDAGNLMFPEDGLALTKRDDNVVIKYTYTNTGDKHYVATMSFDAELTYENMNVEYGIWDFNTNQIKYSNKRYALVVPADQTLSYWIRISVKDKAKSARLRGDFSWLLKGSDKNALGYEEILAIEFTGSNGKYSASFNGDVDALQDGMLIFPSEVSGNPVTSVVANTSLTAEQKQAVTGVVIPESVETIGDGAFEGYTNIEKVTINLQNNAGLTSVGANAFKDCTSLTELTIPSSISSFDTTALTGCSNLKNITLDTMLENAVTAVKNLANTNGEMNIIIGDNVTSIEEHVFYECEGLTSVEISDSVTNIGDYAFYECEKLTNVSISDSVTTIGGGAFYYCEGLTSISIPASVTSIGGGAFYSCIGLTSLTFEEGSELTSIGSQAFSDCERLTSITIPASVTSIGDDAFSGCTGLTSIKVDSNNTFYKSVSNCLIEIASKTLIKGCNNSVIPTDGSVTSIASEAFSNCKGLTSITIPASVTSIGENAFSGCTGLTSIKVDSNNTFYKSVSNCLIEIASKTLIKGCNNSIISTIANVTSIGRDAFSGCTGLTSITIPAGLTSIGRDAFSGCTGLTSITIPASLTSIGTEAFYNCAKLKSVTFEEGSKLTSIGKYAFSDCVELTGITIPTSVTSIGEGVFYNCESLTSITIPVRVTSIGRETFSGCTGLTSITIPVNVTSIGSLAFSDCVGLTSVTIGKNVTSIGSLAFSGCTGLTSITIPASVTSIGSETFRNCTKLTNVTFENPDGWFVASNSTATSGINLSADDLSNTSTAATYLKSTYYTKYWKRK